MTRADWEQHKVWGQSVFIFLCSESKHKRSNFAVQITYSLNLFYSQSNVLSLMSVQERKKLAMTPYLHGSRQNKRQHSLKLSQGSAGLLKREDMLTDSVI